MQIDNSTPFKAMPLPGFDKEGWESVTLIIKGTFRVVREKPVEPEAPDDQLDFVMADEFWGDPGESPVKYESDLAPFKPSTDVVLLGFARDMNGRPTRRADFALSVGNLLKKGTVSGDRAMEKIPLHLLEGRLEGDKWLPPKSRKEGFGFYPRQCPPRSTWAGTYDDSWKEKRSPFLPVDFDYRYFQAAHPGLVAPQYLKGDEPVRAMNVSPDGPLRTKLPALDFHIEAEVGRTTMTGRPALDTVVVDPENRRVILTWRWLLVTKVPPDEVKGFRIGAA